MPPYNGNMFYIEVGWAIIYIIRSVAWIAENCWERLEVLGGRTEQQNPKAKPFLFESSLAKQ